MKLKFWQALAIGFVVVLVILRPHSFKLQENLKPPEESIDILKFSYSETKIPDLIIIYNLQWEKVGSCRGIEFEEYINSSNLKPGIYIRKNITGDQVDLKKFTIFKKEAIDEIDEK